MTQLIGREKKEESNIKVSVFSKMEVLGYHQLKKMEKMFLENFFNSINLIDIDNLVINKTIELMQKRPIEIGDAIIASTALSYRIPLFTENTKDFERISDLELISMSDIL